MGRNLKILIAAILTLVTLAIASCSSTREQSSHPTPTDKPAPRQPFHNPVVSVNKKATNQPFDNPVVVTKQTPPVVPITTGNLIQPTDSTKRVSIVSKGRNDPFAKIVVPYSIKVTNQPAQAKPVLKLPPLITANTKQHSAIALLSKNPLNQQKQNQQKHRINKKAMIALGGGLRIAQSPAPKKLGNRNSEFGTGRLRIAQSPKPKKLGNRNSEFGTGGNSIAQSPTPKKLGNRNSEFGTGRLRIAQSPAPKRVIKHNSVPPVARAFNNKIKPNHALTRVVPKILPQDIPNPALVSITPPQPELAKAVFVSGVILIGKKSQAIIKVPNEPTSQYVHAGQQLANGVLIKRIEINEGSEPVVILEQYGIEVAKMVGQRLTT